MASMQEVRQTLQEIPYNSNQVYLHTDARLMPLCREAWASWNVIGDSGSGPDASVCVTYWCNRLQVCRCCSVRQTGLGWAVLGPSVSSFLRPAGTSLVTLAVAQMPVCT